MAEDKKTESVVNELDELQIAKVVKKPEVIKTPEVVAKEVIKPPVVKTPEKKVEKTEEKVVVDKKNSANKTPEKKVEKKEDKKPEGNPLMQKHAQMLQFAQNTLWNIETDIKRIKLVLSQLAKFDPNDPDSLKVNNKEVEEAVGVQQVKVYEEDGDAEVVEWTYDGYFMVGTDQKKYPVPLNYSSKTKMVPGDELKLKIMSDGRFIYKLVQPAERKHIRAILSKSDDNKYVAMTEEWKMFFLNQAAVTFHKWRPGDELYIVTNKNESGGFAAIEAVIKK